MVINAAAAIELIAADCPLAHFQAELTGAEARIVARSAQRRAVDPDLLPSRIPTSSNI